MSFARKTAALADLWRGDNAVEKVAAKIRQTVDVIKHYWAGRRGLVRALALDTQARDRFYHLFDGMEHIPAREKTLASAREILSPEDETQRIQRKLALVRSGEIDLASLSAEERQELKRQLTLGKTGDAS